MHIQIGYTNSKRYIELAINSINIGNRTPQWSSGNIFVHGLVKQINPKAEVTQSGKALEINVHAALGLQTVLKTNLGPRGTIKM